MEMIEKYNPYEYITGEGGLHVFIKLKNNLNSRELLELCYKDNVLFMPGDIFYQNSPVGLETDTSSSPDLIDFKGKDTFRIGFGRVSDEDIRKGIKIISNNIKLLETRFLS